MTPALGPVPCDEHALLAMWERGLGLDAPAREAWLANHGGALAPAARLGEQRARLLRSLAPWCGRRLALKSRCPNCGEVLSFDIDPAALAETDHGADAELKLDTLGWEVRFRTLAPADIDAALAADGDDEAFVQALLARCVLDARHDGIDHAAASLPEPLVKRLAEQLEAADPLASIGFDVACPACAHAWQASFDAAGALWTCVQVAAERLLAEIDALAQRYGWSEQQILALAPTRRRAYLQLAGLI